MAQNTAGVSAGSKPTLYSTAGGITPSILPSHWENIYSDGSYDPSPHAFANCVYKGIITLRVIVKGRKPPLTTPSGDLAKVADCLVRSHASFDTAFQRGLVRWQLHGQSPLLHDYTIRENSAILIRDYLAANLKRHDKAHAWILEGSGVSFSLSWSRPHGAPPQAAPGSASGLVTHSMRHAFPHEHEDAEVLVAEIKSAFAEEKLQVRSISTLHHHMQLSKTTCSAYSGIVRIVSSPMNSATDLTEFPVGSTQGNDLVLTLAVPFHKDADAPASRPVKRKGHKDPETRAPYKAPKVQLPQRQERTTSRPTPETAISGADTPAPAMKGPISSPDLPTPPPTASTPPESPLPTNSPSAQTPSESPSPSNSPSMQSPSESPLPSNSPSMQSPSEDLTVNQNGPAPEGLTSIVPSLSLLATPSALPKSTRVAVEPPDMKVATSIPTKKKGRPVFVPFVGSSPLSHKDQRKAKKAQNSQ